MYKTTIITIKKLAEIIMNRLNEAPIDFTTDTDDMGNASWNGISKKNIFDADIICIGHYGGGGFRSFDLEENDINTENSLAEFIYNAIAEIDRDWVSDEVNINKTVCIDIDTVSASELGATPMNNTPFYIDSYENARLKNEVDAYRNSRKANSECAEDISQTISNNRSESNHYDLDNVVSTIFSKHIAERVIYVIASEVSRHDWDGRYTKSVKSWAKTILSAYPMLNPEKTPSVSCHSVLLNALAEKIMAITK